MSILDIVYLEHVGEALGLNVIDRVGFVYFRDGLEVFSDGFQRTIQLRAASVIGYAAESLKQDVVNGFFVCAGTGVISVEVSLMDEKEEKGTMALKGRVEEGVFFEDVTFYMQVF